MIADLHCHYPMHLLPGDRDPLGSKVSWAERLRDRLQADVTGWLSHILNDRNWDSNWRVDLGGLEDGGAGIVCSVLYWPPAELDFTKKYAAPPLPIYFDDLTHQLNYVEADLRRQDPHGRRVVVAKHPSDLEEKNRVVFVHCVEGGFHLGPDVSEIEKNVEWLARHGVFYITLAHLFFRQVATNAPAIPMLSDGEYNRIFRQPDEGLTKLGKAAVQAMYKYKVLIDISHMSERAIADTFKLVEKLDKDSGADPEDFPLIATHVGMRDAQGTVQAYNLSNETAVRIQKRGGLIGLITAQHQLGKTRSAAESRKLLCRHLASIGALGNGHASTAIGSDIDGFIRPTLSGFERAADYTKLEKWIRECQPGDAEAILHGNARRVIKRAFEGRLVTPNA